MCVEALGINLIVLVYQEAVSSPHQRDREDP